jgi:hypothetical protein
MAITAAVATAFTLAGGLGYAASAAKTLANATGVSTSSKGEVSKDEGASSTKSAQAQYQEKVVFCHVPPGNPSNAQTLRLPPPAVRAHLSNHSLDHLGPC